MWLDGSRFSGRLPCLACRHARQRKTREEWLSICGTCRTLTPSETDLLHWFQEQDPDRVVVPPNMLQHSRRNSDARYLAARVVLEHHGTPPGVAVLDVGCGISAQAAWFRDYSYVGADINYVRLGRGGRVNSWARYAAQDITQMGFADGAFEAVICLEVIEHLPPAGRDALISELFRVLAPSGVLALSTPNGKVTPWKRVFGRKCEVSHEVELSRPEVEALVARAGGRMIAAEPIDNLILPAGKLAAGITHLVADQPGLRRTLRWLAAGAGYETILYTAVPAVMPLAEHLPAAGTGR